MSNKTQLQTNNDALDRYISRVNAAKDIATNLPEAGGGEPVIEALEITENGTYTAPDGVDGYSPVSVNVPIPEGYIQPSGELEITENGEYDITDKASVVVAVEGAELFFTASGAIYVEELVVPETVTSLNSGIYNVNGFKSITALGVTELKGHYCFGGAWNSLEVLICPRLTSWPGNYWCRGGNLKEVQAGSIGYPVTAMLNAKGFDLNSRSDLVITIYVDATTLAEVPTDVSDYAPFGATKATIVYRNSTTGEVITE